jgi:plasmid stability protein
MWRLIMTKNVTMAFEDDLLDRLRIHAAQHKTSVNAIFRKYAEHLVGIDEKRREAREWMRQKALENMANDAERAAARARGEAVEEETWRWSREETYADRQWPKDK